VAKKLSAQEQLFRATRSLQIAEERLSIVEGRLPAARKELAETS